VEKLTGKVLNDRYEIVSVVGTGGMAVVYKAMDRLDGKYVAVKVLKSEFVSQAKFRKRFLNESKAVAMLSHKNIVNVLDVNFEGDTQYIVMEFIDGRTLKEYIVDYAPLDTREALAYCGQVLNALRHAHERGVVHRDIKPQNIMLLDSGVIKVTDFGIAHVSNFETVTMTDNAIGSVHYISPEQARGHHTDERSDIYSVGVMLYEMVTGKLPFESDTAVSVALMQVQNEPQLPTAIREDLPKAVESIIMKAMQKDAGLRYQHAKDMLNDIKAYFEDPDITFSYPLSTQPVDDGATIVIPVVADAAKEPAKPLAQPEKKKRREYTDQELELRRKKAHGRLVRNRIIAAVAGIFLAFTLVLIGTGVMFTAVESLAGNLIEVESFVGRSISDMLTDPTVKANFIVVQDSRYDNTVGEGIILEQEPESGSYESGKEIKVIVSDGPRMVNIPKIENITAQQAIVLLKEEDLYYEKITQASSSVREGFVIKCDPAPSTLVPAGTTVKIYVAVDTSVKQVKVPNVVGSDMQAAMNKLYEQGLAPTVQEGYSSQYEAGLVYGQSISSDSEVDSGTEIILYVSLGEDPSTLPTDEPEEDDSYYDDFWWW